MSRLRLNQELRNKISSRWRVHAEQEETDEKEKYFRARESIKPEQDKAWDLTHTIVRRHYTDDDVKKARYLQDKFDNVDTIASDSCFHLGYMGKAEERDENDNFKMVDKRISHHFDFKIDGGINGLDNGHRDHDFAYAYFRDELKAQEGCNPDINIEMEGKSLNPHQTKFNDANEKALGFSGGKGNEISHARDWNNDYELDLIGREYCRDRQIPVSKAEFQTFVIWQQAKGQMVMAHYKWIKTVLDQVTKIKTWLKSWKYLDEALDFAKKANCKIDEAEIIRCNSTGLAIFNPQNCAEYLESMKNKNVSREQKISARLKYNKEQSTQ